MQFDFNQTAKSIATVFFAAKIYKALNRYVARKESYIIDEYVSLEDYLFDNYEFVNANYNQIESLIIIDNTGNILNLAGSKQITESELVHFKNGSNVTARINFGIDISNINQLTTIVAGVPQMTEITGQMSSKDVIIKEGTTSNEVEVYDSKTGNLIARIKLIITEKVKPLVKTIFEKIEKIFANDLIRKPFAYIIGLIGSFAIMPIYNKVKNLFKSKQESILYLETVAEDEPDKSDNNINRNETIKINRIANKIVAFISSFFKGFGKILKPFIQFIVALLGGVKDIVLSLLISIGQIFYALRSLFIAFLAAVAYIFIGSVDIFSRGVAKIGETLNIKSIINFTQSLREKLIILAEKLYTFTAKHAAFKNAKIQLKAIFYKAKLVLEKNMKLFEQLMDKPSNQIKPKVVKALNDIFVNAVIKTIRKSAIICLKNSLLVVNKPTATEYQQLCDIVINFYSQLSNIISARKFVSQFIQADIQILQNKLNNEIEKLIRKVDIVIAKLEQRESEYEGIDIVIAQVVKIRQALINLRIS